MKVFLIEFLLLPIFSDCQLSKSVLELLASKPSLYVDSTILNVAETNHVDRSQQPDGVWRIESAGFISFISYSHGHLHGHSLVIYPNGNIATSSYNFFDSLNGPFIAFWPNAKVYLNRFSKSGKLDGIDMEFDSTGIIKRINMFENDMKNGVEILFYVSGHIRIVTQFVNNKESGIRREYRDSDTLECLSETNN